MVLAFSAWPAEASPFAYVANSSDNTVSAIDTAINTVVATIPVGNQPSGVAVTPDGTHVYVANEGSDFVSVIATATNNVAAVTVGNGSSDVAITPDGKHAYVTNNGSRVSSVFTSTRPLTS